MDLMKLILDSATRVIMRRMLFGPDKRKFKEKVVSKTLAKTIVKTAKK